MNNYGKSIFIKYIFISLIAIRNFVIYHANIYYIYSLV